MRWDDVVYEPGELKVVAYKNGAKWAQEIVKTTGVAAELLAKADRSEILSDGKDLAFITVQIADKSGLQVPKANNRIEFSVEGPGEIVATDNGDSFNMESFASPCREAFNGLALVIVRFKAGKSGTITVTAKSSGIKKTQILLKSK